MADELTPQQMQDLLLGSAATGSQRDLLKESRARSEALRKTTAEHQPQQFHSAGAGLLSGLAGGLGNLISQRQHQAGMEQDQALIDAWRHMLDHRGGAQGPAALSASDLGTHGGQPGQMPAPTSPDEAALMAPHAPVDGAMYGHGAQPGMPADASLGGMDPIAELLRRPPNGMQAPLPFSLG